MVILKIPLNIGELDDSGEQAPLKYKQIGSLPLTGGMQKEFARYADMQAQILAEGEYIDSHEFEGGIKAKQKAMAELSKKMEELRDKQAALVLRAFGDRLTLDDWDQCEPAHRADVFAKLMLEANGIMLKNA